MARKAANRSVSDALLRHRPVELHCSDGKKIDFPFPGVVVLAQRLGDDGSLSMVRTRYANHDAGSVATALLNAQAHGAETDYFVYIKAVRNVEKGRRIQSDFDAVCKNT